MSQLNPFETPQLDSLDPSPHFCVRLTSGPTDIFRRATELLGGQYWTFLVMSLVSLLVAAMVPFGLLMGPVLVGLFLCLKNCEQGEKFDINTLLKGLDQFLDSFIVMVVMILINMMVSIPMVIGFLVLMYSQIEPGREPNWYLLFGGLTVFAILGNLISLLTYLPFLFSFQLLADRKLNAIESIRLSFKAAWLNFSSLLVLCLIGVVIYALAALMCLVPALFFIPFWIAVMFAVYREVFPQPASQPTS